MNAASSIFYDSDAHWSVAFRDHQELQGTTSVYMHSSREEQMSWSYVLNLMKNKHRWIMPIQVIGNRQIQEILSHR